MPSSAAVTAAAAVSLHGDYYTLPALPVLAPYYLRQQKLLSPRARRVNYALLDMCERRRIGGHPFYIKPTELARGIDSDDHKRNRRAVRDLEALGIWGQENGIWRPAERVEQLSLNFETMRQLEDWLASLSPQGRPRQRLIVPRFLFNHFPRFNKGEQALSLELLTRCSWDDDNEKNRITSSISLRLHEVAARWGVSYDRLQELLNNGLASIGPNVHLALDDTMPGWFIQKNGRRFLVTVGPVRPSPSDIPEPPESMADGGIRKPNPSSPKGTRKPNPLDLSPNPLFQRDLNPSNPPDAAQDPGAYQPGGDHSQDEDATQGETTDTSPANTADLLPADSDPEDPDVTAQDIDTSPANTSVLSPTDLGPEDEVVITVEDFRALPTTTADPLPTDWAPKLEAETLTPGDDLDTLPADFRCLIDADLRVLARTRVIYFQLVACGYLTCCEANWRHVVTAAVHALRVGKKPCALFHRIVTEQWWSHPEKWDLLSQADEDKAGALIKAQEPAPVDRELRLVRQPDAPPALSEDAKMVAHFLVDELAEKGYRGDPFHAFKKNDRGRDWTRPRWDAALAELETPPEPACLSPAVTPPGLLAWGSELAQIDPPIAALGLPTPAVNTSLQKPTEAPTPQREKMEMMTSQKESIPRPAVPLPEDEPVSLRYFSDARVLSDDGHLLKLYTEAVASGLVSDDEDGLLWFVAAAEHALNASGVPDRPLLFKTIVRGKWGLVPNAAIDRARERLHTINFKRPSHGGPDDVAS